MKTAKDVLKVIKDNDVKYVDFRFTDPRGKWQHVTFDVSMVDEEIFAEGIDVRRLVDRRLEGDQRVRHDADARSDDRPHRPVLRRLHAGHRSATCSSRRTGEPYSRDPRGIAKKAEAYLKSTGIGDTVYCRPGGRVLRLRRRASSRPTPTTPASSSTRSNCRSTATPTTRAATSATASAPRAATSRFRRMDSAQDMRGEMLAAMAAMGVIVEKHHHEVASAQHELGMKFGTLITMADHMQIYKYCIHKVAQSYGKTATFMPKPIFGDNGSGMHVHQSIWKGGKPMFAGNKYADLSQECLCYIGGIIKHAKALNAFTNPSTNSYKRLSRATKPRCCSPTRRATARPPAVFRGRRTRRPSASKSASPIRPRTPTSPSRPC